MTRSLLFSIVILLGVLVPSARAQDVRIPPLTIKGNAVQLGVHEPGGSAVQEIKFRNTSDKAIRITRAAGNCACMALIIRDANIAPGQTGVIILAVDAPKKMGRLTREMYVFAEGYNAPLRLPVYADLEYGVVVNKGAVPELLRREGVLTLSSSDARPFRVLRAGGADPVPGIEGRDPGAQAISHAIRFDLGDADPSELPRFFTIETDHPDAKLIPVRVSVPGVWSAWRDRRRIKPVEEQESLFRMTPGKKKTILVELGGVVPGPPESLSVTSSNPAISARVVAVRKPQQGGGGAACDIEVRADRNSLGPLETVLTFSFEGNEAGLDLFMIVEPRNGKTRGRKSPINRPPGH